MVRRVAARGHASARTALPGGLDKRFASVRGGRRRNHAPLVGERAATCVGIATKGGAEHVVSRRHAECHAVRKMKEGPSESPCRRRLQTAGSCFGQKPRW